jgi:hypothetical protein
VLAHLVDDEDECLARPPPAHQLERPLDHPADRDRRIPVPLGVRPGVGRGVRGRVEVVQDGTGPGELLRPLADHPPVELVDRLARLDELVELALALKLDLQLGDVEVLGVAQLPEQDRVHQLGDPLGHLPRVPLLGDLEEDDLRRHLQVDQVEQLADLLLADLPLEEGGEVLAEHPAVLEGVAEVLGERTLARAEEPGDPDPHALGRLGGGLGDGLQELAVLVPDAVGGDVLGDLGVDRRLVGLIDLDDLLDLAAEVTGEQLADRLHRRHLQL